MKIDEIEQWFKENPPPKKIKVSRFEMITDTDKFIKSHIRTLRANPGNRTFIPYYDRLIQLKKACE